MLRNVEKNIKISKPQGINVKEKAIDVVYNKKG